MIDYNWDSLSADEFEEVCMDLMRKENFVSVDRLSGPGPGDSGRDLHAEEFLGSQTGSTIHTKILVQCKNYFGSRSTISPNDIESWSMRAKSLGYERLFVITSYDLSSTAKIKAKKISEDRAFAVNVQWWNKFYLTKLLIDNPAIKRRYQLEIISSPSLKIGILNGYLDNPSVQSRCHRTFTEMNPEDWVDLLSSDRNSIELINLVDITHEFDAIINPFGEIYPEENPIERKSYKTIVEYIQNGGVFVGTGGFPFFYLYDYAVNDHYVTTSPTLPVIDVRSGEMMNLFTFNDVQFSKDFNVSLDSGNTREVEIMQNAEDKKYVGDLLELGHSHVSQFRSIINQDKEHVIPLIRNADNSLLLLAAIKKGYGYYIHSGFNTRKREAEIISTALTNWLITAGGELSL